MRLYIFFFCCEAATTSLASPRLARNSTFYGTKRDITSDSEATKTKTDFRKHIESAKILPAPRAIQQPYYCILQKHKKIVPENLNQSSVPRELYVQNMCKVAVLPLSNFY